MKKLIAHPEWDIWVILIAVLALLLSIPIAWSGLHGNNRLGALWILVAAIPVSATLILFEARSARKWLAQVTPNSTLRGYMGINPTLALLIFCFGMIWFLAAHSWKTLSLFDAIGCWGFLGATGFMLIRRSRLSPL